MVFGWLTQIPKLQSTPNETTTAFPPAIPADMSNQGRNLKLTLKTLSKKPQNFNSNKAPEYGANETRKSILEGRE